jgi:glutamate racemase
MIGIFDSGVGGLSVLKALRVQLPDEPFLYLADQAHVPYVPRPLEQVRAFSHEIAHYLIGAGCDLVVVACNAASAAALRPLRRAFPQTPFVGMEPAVKPAAETTHSGVVGVLATPATFQGELYASVVVRFASGVTVLQDTCPGLVARIEAGDLDGPAARAILERAILPMLARGMDALVLGCTHYPFIRPLVEQIAGPAVRIIDPAPAVARQVERILRSAQPASCPAPAPEPARFLTTGPQAPFQTLLPRLLEGCCGSELRVERLTWSEGIPPALSPVAASKKGV